MSWGAIYCESWFGSRGSDGWGSVYPICTVTSDSTIFSADTTIVAADNSSKGSTITFDCSNTDVVVQNGTTGNTISIANDIIITEGTIISVSPSTYQNGSSTYTVNIEVPDNGGYDNGGNLLACTDTAIGTGALVAFNCTNAVLSVTNGTIGATISIGTDATITAGTLTSITPSTYQSGTATYTGAITVPSGFSNSAGSINCTDTANGTSSSLPSSPIGAAPSTLWFGFGHVYNGSSFLYPKTVAPLSTGMAPAQANITNFNGTTYQEVANTTYRIDTSSIQVGTFIADFQGTFFDSSNNHNTSFYDSYSYFNTPKFLSLKSSARSSPYTVSETQILKVEQANGYLQVTQIINI